MNDNRQRRGSDDGPRHEASQDYPLRRRDDLRELLHQDFVDTVPATFVVMPRTAAPVSADRLRKDSSCQLTDSSLPLAR